MDCRISNYDDMYVDGGERYFLVGLSAIHVIHEVLKRVNVAGIQSVLDLPCGGGRELRFLVRRFPEAAVSACDIVAEHVEFCSRAFGVKGYYSKPDFDDLSLGEQYDLIWCGSLIPLLPAKDTSKLLRFFERHLRPGGLAIWTTMGDRSAERLKSGYHYGLPKESVLPLLQSYYETGYGYWCRSTSSLSAWMGVVKSTH